jgi:hypothetical protein
MAVHMAWLRLWMHLLAEAVCMWRWVARVRCLAAMLAVQHA